MIKTKPKKVDIKKLITLVGSPRFDYSKMKHIYNNKDTPGKTWSWETVFRNLLDHNNARAFMLRRSLVLRMVDGYELQQYDPERKLWEECLVDFNTIHQSEYKFCQLKER